MGPWVDVMAGHTQCQSEMSSTADSCPKGGSGEGTQVSFVRHSEERRMKAEVD